VEIAPLLLGFSAGALTRDPDGHDARRRPVASRSSTVTRTKLHRHYGIESAAPRVERATKNDRRLTLRFNDIRQDHCSRDAAARSNRA
jgi:hypothetical protein